MSLTRQQSAYTFASASGGQTYLFDVLVDSQGAQSVRNIRGPRGLITDSTSSLPSSVLDDIDAARSTVSVWNTEGSVASGNLMFTGQTYRDAVIAPGVLNNTSYRVVYTPPDGVVIRTENQTTTGFRAVVGTAYGTVALPKIVPYSVLTTTAAGSSSGGTLTFVFADSGVKQVTFATAFATADYRVVLTPNGFFDARVINQLTTGFQIQLGYTLLAAETVTVGYDVFV